MAHERGIYFFQYTTHVRYICGIVRFNRARVYDICYDTHMVYNVHASVCVCVCITSDSIYVYMARIKERVVNAKQTKKYISQADEEHWLYKCNINIGFRLCARKSFGLLKCLCLLAWHSLRLMGKKKAAKVSIAVQLSTIFVYLCSIFMDVLSRSRALKCRKSHDDDDDDEMRLRCSCPFTVRCCLCDIFMW